MLYQLFIKLPISLNQRCEDKAKILKFAQLEGLFKFKKLRTAHWVTDVFISNKETPHHSQNNTGNSDTLFGIRDSKIQIRSFVCASVDRRSTMARYWQRHRIKSLIATVTSASVKFNTSFAIYCIILLNFIFLYFICII